MPCYSPLKGYLCQDGFRMSPKGDCKPQTVPCGQCVGCRLERSRQWAVRCKHEADGWKRNCFITLTYNKENLPKNGSLVYEEFQMFMKRFRKRFSGYQPSAGKQFDDISVLDRLSPFPYTEVIWPIRFYMCGEYGEQFGRPHFHACIFNFDFMDKYLWETTDAGSKIFRSKVLEELWPYGYSSIGDLTFSSAAYVARYIMKKITGKAADAHYETVDEYGVVTWRKPEFNKMSLKPGIGFRWFQKYWNDVYKFDKDGDCVKDSVTVNGRQAKPPRYYDRLLERFDDTSSYTTASGDVVSYSQHMDAVKQFREDFISRVVDDNGPDRLRAKEEVAMARLSMLKRKLL